MPAKSVFTAHSALKLRFCYTPSDYGEVAVYGTREDFIRRFGDENPLIRPNLIVLGSDSHLAGFRMAPMARIFVDLSNLRAWYAKDFLKKLEEIIDGILG